jgi:hypothetical protein
VRGPAWATNPAISPQNVRNDGAVKHDSKTTNNVISETGKVGAGSIGATS